MAKMYKKVNKIILFEKYLVILIKEETITYILI